MLEKDTYLLRLLSLRIRNVIFRTVNSPDTLSENYSARFVSENLWHYVAFTISDTVRYSLLIHTRKGYVELELFRLDEILE